jgi:phosphatidate cytidylyltransferase
MLKQRIITALALLAVLLPALFYPSPEPFCVVAMVLMVAGAWEMARLNGSSNRLAGSAAVLCFAACAVSWRLGLLTQPLPVLWNAAGAGWVLLGAWLLRKGVPGWGAIPRSLRQVGGLLALWLAWLAVAQARHVGINFLLSILLLVWVADVFAYFAGRALGRRKLAPSISPGKSWEGVWGGMAGVMMLALAWVAADLYAVAGVISLYTQLIVQDWWLLPLAVLFLTAMSVVGDLVESLIKRSAGVKDSSGLLPGHGGVLDRVDALLPTLPLAMMLHTLIVSP